MIKIRRRENVRVDPKLRALLKGPEEALYNKSCDRA